MQTWFDGSDRRCRIIAEVGQNHDGSLGTAHAYVEAVSTTGVDAIKFQTHIAEAESTPDEPWRVRFSPQDRTRYDYWKRMEFSPQQWQDLALHARDRGLVFLSSAFSFEAVELLEEIDVPVWKVGAGEITNTPMIDRMAQTGKPVLLSNGLASWSDLDLAVQAVRRHKTEVGVFQCTTAYPCPPEKLGLNVIAEIRERYDCPVGLSDHSGKVYASLAAATLGIDMIEVHVVLSRECFGPDVSSSLTTQELRMLVEGVRFIEEAQSHPVNKEVLAAEMNELRNTFGKSVYAARDIPAGRPLVREDLVLRKPGTGIPARKLFELLNRRLRDTVSAKTMLREDHFEHEKAS